MLNPSFYPHPAQSIRMLQTHISWVFLVGSYAYKLKKPLDLGFLDFTSLEKRHYFCKQELHLNQRLAPAIYLNVLPISLADGSYQLDNTDNIHDYCLKMLRFSQDDVLDQRLNNGTFDPIWMDILAKDIAKFHATAKTNRNIQTFGNIDLLRKHITGNIQVAKEHSAIFVSSNQLNAITQFSEDFILKHAKDFATRQCDGYIRDGHGDLHLKNIALFQGKPVVFDCIEFSDEYRMIDIMSDVAFLVMDCDARGRSDLGFRFLSRYLELSGDYGGVALLPLYLSYRAGVRGKVACLLSDNKEVDVNEESQQSSESVAYFNLAESYTTSAQPRLFAIGGLSGSGKSHLALLGCGIERAIIIRSDATRKQLASKYPELKLYNEEMSVKTYASMFKNAKTALAAGYSVILDATFLQHKFRENIRQLAQSENVKYHILWLDVDVSVLHKHISQRMQTEKDISDATLYVLDMQMADYQRPQEPDIRFLSSTEKWPIE